MCMHAHTHTGMCRMDMHLCMHKHGLNTMLPSAHTCLQEHASVHKREKGRARTTTVVINQLKTLKHPLGLF